MPLYVLCIGKKTCHWLITKLAEAESVISRLSQKSAVDRTQL